MTRSRLLLAAALILALAGMSLVYAWAAAEQPTVDDKTVQVAQAPGGGAGGPNGWRQMTDEERAQMREQMMERVLDRAGLTEQEKTAAKAALQTKEQARRALGEDLVKLRQVADKENPSEQELWDALAAYRKALADYHQKVEATDKALAAKLSVQAQARCMALGILDNGLGGAGMLAGGPGGRAARPAR